MGGKRQRNSVKEREVIKETVQTTVNPAGYQGSTKIHIGSGTGPFIEITAKDALTALDLFDEVNKRIKFQHADEKRVI